MPDNVNIVLTSSTWCVATMFGIVLISCQHHVEIMLS